MNPRVSTQPQHVQPVPWPAAGRPLPAEPDGSVREFLEAENARTERVLADLAPLEREIFDEMKSRIQDTAQEVLIPPFFYYLRFHADRQYPVYFRRHMKSRGSGEALVDLNRLAGRRPFFHVGTLQPSPDHRWLAYSYDARGAGFYTLAIMALPAGPGERAAPPRPRESPARWRRLDGSRSGGRDTSNAVWAGDSRFLFYTVLDEGHRPCAVYRHRIGGDPADDVVVLEEADPGYFVSLGRTESGAFITFTVHNYTTTEVRVLPARPADGYAEADLAATGGAQVRGLSPGRFVLHPYQRRRLRGRQDRAGSRGRLRPRGGGGGRRPSVGPPHREIPGVP